MASPAGFAISASSAPRGPISKSSYLLLSLNKQDRRLRVGARDELNKHHILGAIGLAAIVGTLTGSWTVFVVAAATMIGVSLYSREIRPRKGGRW
jgi:hypothetical protein